MGKLFGTDGIRGTAGSELTAELVAGVGRALVAACSAGDLGDRREAPRVVAPRIVAPRIVVGRDTRVSGPELEAALVEGIADAGGIAMVGGILPTAGVAYLTAELGADAGVVVSASHNPPQDNGVKLFGPGGWKLPLRAEAAIEERVLSGGVPSEGGGEVRDLPEAREAYLAHLTAEGRADLSGLRVVVDCANGAASGFAPEAFERLGAVVVALNADGDGSRINDGCGALHPGVVAEAARREGGIGITLDGDADRVLLADEDGALVDGDGIIALLARRMRADNLLRGDAVVVTVMSNQALRRWCAANGIAVIETPVGDRHVLEALRDGGYVLGGEQAGHVARLDQMTTGDGILVGLDVCGIVAASGERLAEIVPFVPMPQVLVNVPVPRANGLDASDRVRRAVASAHEQLGGDGRVLVRPSGTEPVVRVMVEAPDETLADELAGRVAEAVREEAG